MLLIRNQPCGHPLIAVNDVDTDRAQAALNVFHDYALQTQTELVHVDDEDPPFRTPCRSCQTTLIAFMDAQARRHILTAAEDHDVSGFTALEAYQLLQECRDDDGPGLPAPMAAVGLNRLINAGWRPPAADGVAVPELDPRRAGS